jgi:hypothetical protein
MNGTEMIGTAATICAAFLELKTVTGITGLMTKPPSAKKLQS